MIDRVRKEAGKYIKQMHHCTRCVRMLWGF